MENYKFYLNLTETESIKLADKAIKEITDDEQLGDVLLRLALFTNGKCLKSHYFELIDKRIFYPGEIYLHADEKVADALIGLIENNSASIDNLLICLAWTGTKNVVDFFVKSSEEKPVWTENLYVSPKDYANAAGWVIDENNHKVVLIDDKISVFAGQNFSDTIEVQSKTFVEKSDVCNFCKNNLTSVFETEIDSRQISFSTCLLCSCYEPFFMRIDEKGKSHRHEANKKWKHFDSLDLKIEKIKENTLFITNESRKSEFTISQFVEISKSQIGGYPTWVQYADYLDCPDCNRKMKYVGQIDMEDVEEYSEGIYYFHYCKNCKISGTNYQQT